MFIVTLLTAMSFYCVQIGHILHGRIKDSGFLQLEQNDPSIA